MINKLIDILFPPKCAFCGTLLEAKSPVCGLCMETLPFSEGKTCKICSRPLGEFSYDVCSSCHNKKKYFSYSFVPLIYEGSARKTVIDLKHNNHPYYAKALAFLIADKILSSPEFCKFDYVTCIPQNSVSKRKRGYNQSELIAKELSHLLKIPFIKTLKRSNEGARQATLNAKERHENVRQCYSCDDKTFDGGTVLLTDDVYTTGETANYCSKLLRDMGFDKVYLAISMIRQEE